MIVGKVGGSLYDDPRLGPALRTWVSEQPEPVLLVPGGGAFADAVRELDRVHRLGEEAAHWLAVASLAAPEQFLRRMLADTPVAVLDVRAFCQSDHALPHTWAVTTDSIALRAAVVGNATRLVLLKSTDIPPDTSWETAAARGWVDPHFPVLMGETRLPVSAVNFRTWMKNRFGTAAGEVE